IQVYRFKGGESQQPEEEFSTQLGESIRSIEGGCVSSSGYLDVVMATFGGRVCALTTESLKQAEAGDTFGRTVGGVNNQNRLKQLRKEVEALEKKIDHEKERLDHLEHGNGDHGEISYMPATPHFQVIRACHLDPFEAAYRISIEIPVPLDIVLLHSNVFMDLIDTSEEDMGQAICSITSLSPEGGDGICATYRCQEAMTRLMIKTRTTEGDYGDICLTVVAKTPSNKTAQVIHFPVKPLSLHHRLNSPDESMPDRPMNVLKLRGSFSMAVMHDWIGMCLPDLPPRPSGEEATVHFRNVYTGAVLSVEYRRGEAIARSDSVSSLAIVKELISKEATARRIQISDSFQVKTDSTTVGNFVLD
ncbi:unnamed protein product, partial [Choristocarpus tenellus]